jgi:hypothetical protein
MARSSSGLGRWPLTPVTRVRVPYGLPLKVSRIIYLPFLFDMPPLCRNGRGTNMEPHGTTLDSFRWRVWFSYRPTDQLHGARHTSFE